ncbi:YiiX/YebB-like N1pC/P60 family cysteine hydrolase [Marinicellulosiphila megalodicopiae]|uniref:YiiX/YebB-like N1pC/P60 family cysteine hydrolase n=1 Tax=Marinicellulosiphila megalodicopiae TaxID=2724896 RepID=UPI003BB114C6
MMFTRFIKKSVWLIFLIPSVLFGFEDSVEVGQFVIQRQHLQTVVRHLQTNQTDFLSNKSGEVKLLNFEKKQELLDIWQAVAEYTIALEALSQSKEGYYFFKQKERSKDFYLHFTSMSSAYHFALDFIDVIEKDDSLRKILDQSNEDLGLGDGAYKKFKRHFLDVTLATRYSALYLTYKTYEVRPPSIIQSIIDEDREQIVKYGKDKGVKMSFFNALDVVKSGTFKAWFPVQKGIANTMGSIKFWRNGQSLISIEDVHKVLPIMQPGDVLLERREWQATNIGIPGFWTHTAMFIGNEFERDAFFDDEQTTQWIKRQGIHSGRFSELLKRDYPSAFIKSTQQEEGFDIRVIESLAEGVIFTSLERSFAADSAAVLRPRLTKLERAKAIYNSFYFEGLPYDYNFDFLTDDALVCSELIVKSYLPRHDQKGIEFPLKLTAGRLLMPANQIGKLYSEQYQTDKQQFDLVVFLDGNESDKASYFSDEASFIKSWKRPKWHIIIAE